MANRNLKHIEPAANRQLACGIYARTAVADQVALVRQVRSCAGRVVELGGQVEAVYADNGWPGTKIGPEMRRLLDDARSGRLNCVIVEGLDRVARTPVTGYLLQELKAIGVDVQTVNAAREVPLVFPFERARRRVAGRRSSKVRVPGHTRRGSANANAASR